MFQTVLIALILLSTGMQSVPAAENLKKIRIASKAPGETLIPYVISQRLVFYRDEGLEVEVIVTRGTVTT